jgi:hypothetical protein
VVSDAASSSTPAVRVASEAFKIVQAAMRHPLR